MLSSADHYPSGPTNSSWFTVDLTEEDDQCRGGPATVQQQVAPLGAARLTPNDKPQPGEKGGSYYNLLALHGLRAPLIRVTDSMQRLVSLKEGLLGRTAVCDPLFEVSIGFVRSGLLSTQVLPTNVLVKC
jgi:hypothetical protein